MTESRDGFVVVLESVGNGEGRDGWICWSRMTLRMHYFDGQGSKKRADSEVGRKQTRQGWGPWEKEKSSRALHLNEQDAESEDWVVLEVSVSSRGRRFQVVSGRRVMKPREASKSVQSSLSIQPLRALVKQPGRRREGEWARK